jgi:hypothetical protein
MHPRLRDVATVGLILVAGACARLQSLLNPAPAIAPAAAPKNERPLPYPVFETNAFARAVARGTRTRTGEPGPNYWQQFARYDLRVELEPVSSQLNGRGTVRYFNHSPDTLRELWVHLHQNLFAPNAVRNEVTPVTGGTEVLRVAAQGQTLARRDTGVGYSISATRMRIIPPRAVVPGDSADLRFDWSFIVPPDGGPRGGSTAGREAFMVSYWYPQLAVYDDVNGWQVDPYVGNAEFYMGYADYDVSIGVPAGWLVGGTGELRNPEEVLTPRTRDRLRQARQTGEIVHVVADADRGSGDARSAKATLRGLDNRLTWRFQARNVRDFDWGASDQYLWDATIAVVGDRNGDARPDTANIYSLYRPEVRKWAWDQSARYARHSIEFLSGYLWPYPYPQMTSLDGPVSCSGMEYPMLTCIGGPRDTLALYSVTVHELAHMWFPMQVGSDERRFAWMDEGVTRFNQAQGMQAFFTGYDREKLARDNYLRIARTDDEVELMRHGDLYPFGTNAYAIATYDKMATNMVALRALVGNDAFLRAYRSYGQRWVNKHPTPYDFWNSFNFFTGRDLSWFWRTWWFERWTLDQAIASVATEGTQAIVTVEDHGLAPMPVRLAITRTDGRVERREVPVDVWLAGVRRTTVSLDDGSTVRSVEIDPEQSFPDIDRGNNRWVRPESLRPR